MQSNLTSTNISFNYLGGSKDFLNTVINNINSCVMFLNKKMELQAFNDAFKTIFSNKKDEDLLYVKCGEAIGCAYSVEEMKDCGTTSKCKTCELRRNALDSYVNRKAIFKQKISREFYTTESTKSLKHLQYSVRPFYFEKEYYILLITEDITNLIEKETTIENQLILINKLRHGSTVH